MTNASDHPTTAFEADWIDDGTGVHGNIPRPTVTGMHVALLSCSCKAS